MSAAQRAFRIALAGASGTVGGEVVAVLGERRVPVAELLPFASASSFGADVELYGEVYEVRAGVPALRGLDLLVLCTPRPAALELLRESLRAELPCIDCSGALAAVGEIPLVHADLAPPDGTEPALALPVAPALSWAPVLAAVASVAPISAVRGTLLRSAAWVGRAGQGALSDETVALLTQVDPPEDGPFGQPVAFDALPLSAETLEAEVARDLRRLLRQPALEVALACVQVPTFVGEGSDLWVELAGEADLEALKTALGKAPGIRCVGGPGPGLRESAGGDEVLVAPPRLYAAAHRGGPVLHVWLASDPVRLVASHTVRAASARLAAHTADA